MGKGAEAEGEGGRYVEEAGAEDGERGHCGLL